MKLTRTILSVAIATAVALTLSACNKTGQNQSEATTPPPAATTAPAPASTAKPAPMPAATTAMPAASSSITEMVAHNQQAGNNWFGGPIYHGEPALAVTAALVKAGGGAKDFDFSKALVSMLGEKTVKAEVEKLTKQYGKEKVDNFVSGMTFAVKAALKRATEQGIKLPEPAKLQGADLAKALVKAGTAPDGTFWSGYLFDHALSHTLHNQVMADIDAGPGQAADSDTHMILNQAMYDVAQALGEKDVKLAPFH